jgi:hypothetical protein
MSAFDDPKVAEFLRDREDAHMKSIAGQRAFLQAVFLLAGAIAAFSVPLYVLDELSAAQHVCIALSIVSLVLCILIGVWHLGSIFTKELSALKLMEQILLAKDPVVRAELEKQYDSRRTRRGPDLVGFSMYILFGVGCLGLIALVVAGEWGL